MRLLNYTLLLGCFWLSKPCALVAQYELTQVFEGQDTFYVLPAEFTHLQMTTDHSVADLPDGKYREYLYEGEEIVTAESSPTGYVEFSLHQNMLHDTFRHFTATRELLRCGEYRYGLPNGYWYEYTDTTLQQPTQKIYYEDGLTMQLVFYAPEGYLLRRDIHFYENDQTEKVLTTWFHPNGRLARQGVTIVNLDGKRIVQKAGQWRTWHQNGELRALEYYERGDYSGKFEYFHPDGSLDRIAVYKKGRLKNEIVYEYLEEESTAAQALHLDKNGKVRRIVEL